MGLLESVVVGGIVTVCALFSIWRLLSLRLRLMTLAALAGLPAAAGGRFVARLRQKTLSRMSGGCGACQNATHTLNANVQPLNRKPGAPLR